MKKDRAEQQLVVGMLDGLREWLAFRLPIPPDRVAAHALMVEQNKRFLEHLPPLFVSQSKAKVKSYMDANHRLAVSEMRHWPPKMQGRKKGTVLVLHELECGAEMQCDFSRWTFLRIGSRGWAH